MARVFNDGSTCEYSYENLNKYQITVHEDFQIPSWYKEGVMYNIFVDRFNNGNRNKKPSNPKKIVLYMQIGLMSPCI